MVVVVVVAVAVVAVVVVFVVVVHAVRFFETIQSQPHSEFVSLLNISSLF